MTKAKTTKTKTYISHNGEVFISNNGLQYDFQPVDYNTINDQQKGAITGDYGWIELGEQPTIEAAHRAYISIVKARASQRKEANGKIDQQIAEKHAAEWATIKDMDVIQATADNIRILLQHLNTCNWGGWVLPKMNIRYTANQFDCDGQLASTITLDSGIECDGKKISKFKVGGRGGHLNKYTSL